MKKKVDFSKGVRGKFFRTGVELRLPVYLDKANLVFVEKLAKKDHVDLSSVVNRLLKADRELVRAAR